MIISEYTGGGFGSKIPGAISMAIPALLSKKANAPVMMRITREEEHFIGRARPGIIARVKMGFRKDGRITAIDMYTVRTTVRTDAQGDARSAASAVSLAYQPETMRWRSVTVLTNTPPKTSQRAPGGMQGIGIVEPIISKAAKKLGLDQVEVRKINAPAGHAPFGPPLPNGKPGVRDERLRQGSARQGPRPVPWESARSRRSTTKHASGTKARGIGVAVSPYAGGSIGFDGLFVIKPDGRITVPVGHRQSRHALDVRRTPAGGRNARRALGAVRRRVRQHEQEPAVDLRLGRQPDGARDDARGARGGDRRDQEAAGDRSEDAAAAPRSLQGRDGRVSGPGGGDDLRAGRAESDRARRQVRRPRSCRRHQRLHENVGARRSPGRA